MDLTVAWEYLELTIPGHNGRLIDVKNMLVTTSDGRFSSTKMPRDVVSIVNQLGAEGWEMVGYVPIARTISSDYVGEVLLAWFKRPRGG